AACASRPASVEQDPRPSSEPSPPSIAEAVPPRAQAPAPTPAAGPAHPINLARTSLASVDASSTNGPREMENPYYGVLNAFDDGENWIDNHNYTYWESHLEEQPYIDVHFDVPVTLTRVELVAAAGTVFAVHLK